MSFSTQTKNELARVFPESKGTKLAELAALIRMSGTIQLAGFKKLNFKISTENAAIARKHFKLLKGLFGINTEVTVQKSNNLKKNNMYVMLITYEMGANDILEQLEILRREDGSFFIENSVPQKLLKDDEARRAYIRGAFLGAGSISDPEKTYHIEFVVSSNEFGEQFKELINSYGLNSKIAMRKNSYVVYIKESEQISDILNIMGAHKALLSLENTKIVKQMRNDINRIVNCETANLSKTIDASIRQIENIRFIKDTVGLSALPPNLREIANLRLENENLSLKELGQMLSVPLGKSGVNHRLRKIEQVAERIRGGESIDRD
ncbi:MAG: DNA-binding protein WhiA [Peptoclostridium sp.]|uniref:DNA-binding protein WhiA n=1 Tax=Peptoclostridium sp. TaxID=1904860 RepID=UPI00139C76C1|nr:DNA-binding protein WhiA [Peptoclostridium sp.]MZQ74651.1 DNA-binding protein WhiA [Peptoclostridium sp.]